MTLKTNRFLQGITKFISLAKGESRLAALLDELLTPAEIAKVHERIKIISGFQEGMTQREIVKKTGAAIATVTRGSALAKKSPFIAGELVKKASGQRWWRRLFWQD